MTAIAPGGPETLSTDGWTPGTAAAGGKDTAWRLCGGTPLTGTVEVFGAKNAIGKQLIASLLTTEPCTFTNVPRMRETAIMLDILSDLGTSYEWLDHSTLRVQTAEVRSCEVSQRHAGVNRLPVLMLAPLMHRCGEARVPMVGGDAIGTRPVNFHIDGLRAMGATVEVDETSFRGAGGPLHGASFVLPYPSVGATEQLIFAATLARGTTVIGNAAVEPEILDTVLLLQQMGALITVDTDRRIIVEGVTRLRGASHRVVPDRIEAASFACLGVATGGRVTVRHARQEHLVSFLNHLQQMGGGFTVDGSGESMTFFRRRDELRPIHLETDVHPGFMTDWQQPFVAMMTQATGMSVVHETVYEERFGYISTLHEMGAEIQPYTACLGSKPCRFRNGDYVHSCVVRGPTRLTGATMTIPDIRAGFAYVVAALVADGVSELRNVHHLERGYSDVANRLAGLGVEVQVI